MATTTEMSAASGVAITTDQAADMEIPVYAGLQRQGDVIIIPMAGVAAKTAVPSSGTPVVRGENGGNTHAVFAADGPVFCDVQGGSASDLQVAVLSVPEGSTAYLGHPEHGFMGIAAGGYTIRRQREMAEELRMVAD